ncbi:sulfotransferase [Microbaculum marinum]|uniref:Sulfotransferase n=1 Tax=Microbaculum marinum TaxID=1764581 RepID=A0AAW9RJF4_9HYPH
MKDNTVQVLKSRLRRALVANDLAAADAVMDELSGVMTWAHVTSVHDIPLVAAPPSLDAQPPAGFVFVSGAPRSGTTALGRLLNSHPDIGMFTEFYSERFGYSPEMFSPAYIAELYARGLLPTLNKHKNESVLAEMGGFRIVGDKRPNFMYSAQLTLKRFAGHRVSIVHIVRDPYAVAHSYLQRARDNTWSESRDHKVAADEINKNTLLALALLESERDPQHQVLIVDYDELWQSRETIVGLFSALGLSGEELDVEGLDNVLKNALAVARKPREFSSAETEYLEQNLDLAGLERLMERKLELLHGAPG